MMDNDYQNDFFAEQVSIKKARKPHQIMQRYSQRRLLSHIRVPVEYIVIIAIITLVLIIIAYAIGVERGKNIQSMRLPESVPREMLQVEDEVEDEGHAEPVMIEEDVSSDMISGEQQVEEIAVEEEDVKKKEITTLKEPVYVIQLASFQEESEAQMMVDGLKDTGVNAVSAKKGKWYQVSAEGYQTIEEAKAAQKVFLENYKDCYIKKVNPVREARSQLL